MSSDAFLDYLKANSFCRVKEEEDKELRRKEGLVGREKTTECELHAEMGLPAGDDQIVADHCHRTGEYRGWICSACNMRVLPEIDRLLGKGYSAEHVKAFLEFVVDYAATRGDVFRAGRAACRKKYPRGNVQTLTVRRPSWAGGGSNDFVASNASSTSTTLTERDLSLRVRRYREKIVRCLSRDCRNPCENCPFK